MAGFFAGIESVITLFKEEGIAGGYRVFAPGFGVACVVMRIGRRVGIALRFPVAIVAEYILVAAGQGLIDMRHLNFGRPYGHIAED